MCVDNDTKRGASDPLAVSHYYYYGYYYCSTKKHLYDSNDSSSTFQLGARKNA